MSKGPLLRSLVEQRISLAAAEIFGLFERTIAEYEEELRRSKEENQLNHKLLEELRRSKEENQRSHKLLEAVWNPDVLGHTTDVQLLLVAQDQSPSLDPEPDPNPPHIKQEQEAEVTRGATPTPVPVKSESDEEEVHHRPEPHGPDAGPDLNPVYVRDLNCRPEPDSDTNGPRSIKAESPVVRRQVGQKSTVHRCPECGQTFGFKSSLKTHEGSRQRDTIQLSRLR
ncbi:uncharacterized protein LOC115413899 [Sphaeramia orbicularis]|uniref:uncharacterized protein LOC115413899 n=1 Tax=Sphaeramia orbicularis TaxID=375764 RepID=UPI00117FD093|nr:uncharacterized protein LOC115413899 [Sphaeramia orbicularis]